MTEAREIQLSTKTAEWSAGYRQALADLNRRATLADEVARDPQRPQGVAEHYGARARHLRMAYEFMLLDLELTHPEPGVVATFQHLCPIDPNGQGPYVWWP